MRSKPGSLFFFFNDTATTEIYTLSLHDALPISLGNSEDRGDLTVRVAFDVEQHYRQAPPLGQLGERLAQPLVQRPPLGRRVGSRAAGREPDVDRLDLPGRAGAPPVRGGREGGG